MLLERHITEALDKWYQDKKAQLQESDPKADLALTGERCSAKAIYKLAQTVPPVWKARNPVIYTADQDPVYPKKKSLFLSLDHDFGLVHLRIGFITETSRDNLTVIQIAS